MEADTSQSHGNRRPLVFVFSSRGMQWHGVHEVLDEAEPIFLETLRQCDLAARRYIDWSIEEELRQGPEAYRFHASDEHNEPVLTALQVALHRLWESKGVRPGAVVSMSGGEYAAGYAAGVLSLEDAMLLACTTSWCFRKEQGVGLGAMMTVALGREDMEALMPQLPERVHLAVDFGPQMTGLSGEGDAIERAAALLESRGVRCWRSSSRYALHSPLWDGFEREYTGRLDALRPGRPTMPIYSASVGGRVQEVSFDARHWWAVFRKRASYVDAVRRILDGHETFLEIGPHPILTVPIQEMASSLGKEIVTLPSLHRDERPLVVLERSLEALRSLGYVAQETG